jgi:hypothetical protein
MAVAIPVAIRPCPMAAPNSQKSISYRITQSYVHWAGWTNNAHYMQILALPVADNRSRSLAGSSSQFVSRTDRHEYNADVRPGNLA